MRRLLFSLYLAGLVAGLAPYASASPVFSLIDHATTQQVSKAEPVDYYWNHRRYRHRAWDRRYHRWRYY